MYEGVFILRGERAYLAEAEDVSTGGASLARPRNWSSAGDGSWQLFFIIDQDTLLRFEAHLVHESERRIGFEFEPGFAREAEELVGESRRWS